MRKLGVLVIIALLSVTMAFAEGQQEQKAAESAEDEKLTIGYVVKCVTNPYYHQVQIGAEEAAKKGDARLIFQAPARHGDTEAQVKIVEDMLTTKPDALCLIPDNYTALLPVLKQYNQADIPIIIADTKIKKGVVDYLTFVGYDDATATEKVANYVAENIGESGNVAILEGQRGVSTAEARLEGFKNGLAQYPDIEIVSSLSAGWDREKGLNTASDIIQAHSEIKAILAANDEMALGAVQAVKEAGLEDQIVVTGFDAIKPALEAVKNGDLLCTVDANPKRMGEIAVEVALDYLKEGKEPKDEILYPITIVTKEKLQ